MLRVAWTLYTEHLSAAFEYMCTSRKLLFIIDMIIHQQAQQLFSINSIICVYNWVLESSTSSTCLEIVYIYIFHLISRLFPFIV